MIIYDFSNKKKKSIDFDEWININEIDLGNNGELWNQAYYYWLSTLTKNEHYVHRRNLLIELKGRELTPEELEGCKNYIAEWNYEEILNKYKGVS